MKAKSRMTKKMALTKAAEGSKKIMDWIRPTARQVVDMDWSDDVNIPVGESIITIKRKEEAKRQQESWRVKMMCKDEVECQISHVESRSVAGAMMTGLVNSAWAELCRRKICSMLEAEEDLKSWKSDLK